MPSLSRAQQPEQQAPVPTEPAEEEAEVAPGFGEEKSGAGDETPPKDKRQKKKYKGRDTGLEELPDQPYKPVSVPSKGDNERLIEDINTATGEVTLAELLDEILADVVAEIDTRPAKMWSPMAIRQVYLGKNVTPSFAKKLASIVTAQIHAGSEVRMVDCLECDSSKTKIENGNWVFTNGLTDTEEMRAVAEKIGVKAFMDVTFGFDPATGVLEMQFSIIRARDSYVLWSDSFRADETTPILLRSSEAPIKRRDRLRDLEMLLEGRPYYGIAASAGFMILPHNDPMLGDIGGATAGFRVYERFGVERRVMFGLDLTGFLNTSRLAGAVISAGAWWIPIRPDFVNPELRLGAKAGAFIAGTAGNAAVFQLGAELLLRYRFGLFGYVLFMTKSEFPPDSDTQLGGLGFATGMSFNW